MEYRISNQGDRISTIGIGSAHMHEITKEGIREIVDLAEKEGVNLIDLAMSYPEPMAHIGAALKGRREKFFLQMHLGLTFPEGQYLRSRNLDLVRESFEKQLADLGTDYADFAFIHCVDEQDDYDIIMKSGIIEYAQELKRKGKIRYLGFASHTVEICHQFLETGLFDTCLFSINAAYDLNPVDNIPFEELDTKGKDKTIGSKERSRFYRECDKNQVDIQVMKAYGGGTLLKAESSPFNRAMTIHQCLKYVLDRPAVMSVPVGVRSLQDLKDALEYYQVSDEEKDYSFISTMQPKEIKGTCVYCNHCLPCPQGIDIGAVHKYLDLFIAGDELAREHYLNLTKRAKDCIFCGSCERNCPFGVDVRSKMRQAIELIER